MLEQEREFNFNMKYFDELKKSMEYLGSKKDTLFIGQVQKMCTTIEILKLENPDQIFPAYKKAYERDDGVNTILVEYGDYYNEK